MTVMTQGSGKVRAVAKGIRKTTSRFGARLEPEVKIGDKTAVMYQGGAAFRRDGRRGPLSGPAR